MLRCSRNILLPMPMCEFAVGGIVLCFAALSLQSRYVHDRVSWCPKSPTAWLVTSCSTACPGWDQKKHRNSLIRDVIICNIAIVFYSIVITVTQPERHDVSNTQPLDCCSAVCPCLQQRKHPHSLTGDVVICNTEMALLSQWRHLSVMMFPITSLSTVCSIACPG